MSDVPQVDFEVSPFAGCESEILRLRNDNRSHPETLAYLRWRYERQADCPEPRIFWVSRPGGERIGMAAAVFRSYQLDAQRAPVAVIGDISLEAPWRGHGLGRALLRFLTQHLEEHYAGHAALVIPTESARRALDACGWHTAGALVPQVYLLDPRRYLRRVLGDRLAQMIAAPVRSVGRRWLARHVPRGGALLVSARLTDLGQLPRPEGARGSASRELSGATLDWRYVRHPHTRFQFAALKVAGESRAVLVFEDSTFGGARTIYDLLGRSPEDIRGLLALFTLEGVGRDGLSAVRASIAGRHPAHATLRRLGFITRPDESAFQVHSVRGGAERLRWLVSQGDKDI